MNTRAKSFAEICIRDRAEFQVSISEEMHNGFSQLSGDHSPIHSDYSFSRDTSFGNRIGYAFLLVSFLSRLYGEYLPGGSSICIKQECSFIKPYFIGDSITIVGEVINKVTSTKFVEIETNMFRDDEERVFRGRGTVQVVFDEQ